MERYQRIVLVVALVVAALIVGYAFTGAYRTTAGLIAFCVLVGAVLLGGLAWAFRGAGAK